jgi:hypothetical protein
MKKYLVSLLLAAWIVFPSTADPDRQSYAVSQEMLPLSSPVYEEMDALYLVSGLGTPSNSRPWTKTEANLILKRLDRATLNETGRGIFDKISMSIAPGLRFHDSNGFGFDARFDAAVEAYWHSNTGYDQEADWLYGFEQRKPLARVSLDFSLKDFLYVYCDMQYQRNMFNVADTWFRVTDVYTQGIGAIIPSTDTAAIMSASSWIYRQTFLTNVLEHSYDFDYQWPKRAISSIGTANWNISLSRDKIRWGNGHSGNFVVDDHVDYQEFARLVAFSDRFKYDWLNVFLDINTSQGENPDSKFKLLMAHRLEFRILKNLTFAVSENVMYQNTVFDLRYLNPAFIYHNLNNSGMFNAIAHAEVDYNFAKGFNFYAQYVMDQARAPNEGTAQADANGYLAGVEYASLIGPGILSTSLEFASTSPLLYRREKVDFLMFRKYFTNGDPTSPNYGLTGYILNLDYIGYPYGGDALVLQWDCSYRVPNYGTIGLKLFGMRHGEMNFFMSHNSTGNNAGYADYAGVTPSGDAIADTFAASLAGEYELPRFVAWASSKLWLNFAFVTKSVYTKSTASRTAWDPDLQLTTGLSLSF